MIASILITLYTCGWILSVPGALKRVMLKEVCRGCLTTGGEACRTSIYSRSAGGWTDKKIHGLTGKAPRGSVRDRDGLYVTGAAILALMWPLRLAWLGFANSVALLGHGAARLVIRSTTLTQPELERRMTERANEIDRLTKEINEKEA